MVEPVKRPILWCWLALLASVGAGLVEREACVAGEVVRPNILWLSAEDISPHLGCYGDPHAITPELDQLAAEGVRYDLAFTTAGVCAPCRSGIITGVYQTTLGTHHMRCQARLPEEVRPFPVLLRQAGYYCTNNSKEDYQFRTPQGTWDESNGRAHWRNRPDESQPFFSVFNFVGCHESGIASESKYRSVTRGLSEDERQEAGSLTTLPPYYADTERIREDWKRNYELITAMDHWAGGLLQQLEEDGLAESTIVFFWSDHGVGLPRAKRWVYDSGTRIPLIIRIPEAFRRDEQGVAGSVSRRLVSSIDLAPTVLELAGVAVPEVMQGQAFLGPDSAGELAYVFSARDRMDERYDVIRSVRDQRFRYVRNYEPTKVYYQYMNTSEQGATMHELRSLYERGALPDGLRRFFEAAKPAEELYDCEADPHEMRNLATDPAFGEVLERFRVVHATWMYETQDLGLVPEPLLERFDLERGVRMGALEEWSDETRRMIVQAALRASREGVGFDVRLGDVEHENVVVRYWGLTGIGNFGWSGDESRGLLQRCLGDSEPMVRLAAARALCRGGDEVESLNVVTDVLERGTQWERLAAALILDELDEAAMPAIEAMRAALVPRTDLFAKGKYTVRVINRALNELEGTDRRVP